MSLLRKWRLPLAIVVCASIGVLANSYPGSSSFELGGMTGPQDVRSLDRRLSSLEQRLYSIEVSINRLERSALTQRNPVLRPDGRDQEINLLQRDLQALKSRLSELECGLVKLDERTMTSADRNARASAGTKIADPCRLNPGTILRLSNRP